MAATLIAPNQAIEVKALCIVLFGGPGVGKTSLAQTAQDPFTLDFDNGIHRSFNRKQAMRFESWRDVEATVAEVNKQATKTVVVDTVGRLLDLLSIDIIEANAKHGTRTGGLALQGYGALKSRFAFWINSLKSAGKDIILIAHEKEEKDGDDRYFRPEVVGGSYSEVHKVCDLMGWVSIDRKGQRTISFVPGDKNVGKDSAGLGIVPCDKLEASQHFMANLIADAKKRIGQISAQHHAEVEKDMAPKGAATSPPASPPPPPAAGGPPKKVYYLKDLSAEHQELCAQWKAWIKDEMNDIAEFNQAITDSKENIKGMDEPLRKVLWGDVILAGAKEKGWEFDGKALVFVKAGGA